MPVAASQSPDRWWERVTGLLDDVDAPAYGGEGVSLLVGHGADLRPQLAARGLPAARSFVAAHPATARALALATADADMLEGATVSPFALVPCYLRGSDAEVKRRLDATPDAPSADVDVHTGGPVDGSAAS
jgi:hypothetical protein